MPHLPAHSSWPILTNLALAIGYGRIVASGIEVPNMVAILVERSCKATMRPNPTWLARRSAPALGTPPRERDLLEQQLLRDLHLGRV